ncbi:hypothetical protein Tco_0129248 [Tanacetum coccineum]
MVMSPRGGLQQTDDVAKIVFRMRNGTILSSTAMPLDDILKPSNSTGGVDGRQRRKLSICGRPQWVNDRFGYCGDNGAEIALYIMTWKQNDLEACLEKGRGDCLIEHEAREKMDVIGELDFEAKYHLGKANGCRTVE